MNGDVEASQPVDPRITRSGTIEGKTVEDIVLDGRVRIRCAHGDTREYPLSSIEIGIGEAKFQVEAAACQNQKEDLTFQTSLHDTILRRCSTLSHPSLKAAPFFRGKAVM